MNNKFLHDIIDKATCSRDKAISTQSSASKYIDQKIPIPSPFLAGEISNIRLIVIGQDPKTEGEPATTVLQLDKPNSKLSKFCQRICIGLGFDLYKEVYATNLCKWFFTSRPTQIKCVDVLNLTRPYWYSELLNEINYFNQDTIVVTLGEPVLNLIQSPISSHLHHEIKKYWGHTEIWNHIPSFNPRPSFKFSQGENNIFRRIVLPLPHINSVNKKNGIFYDKYMDDYLAWAKGQI